MPETYTGTEGTAAFNDGMTVLDGTEDRRNGWLAINKARDYIVSRCAKALTDAKAYTDQKVSAISLTWNAITGKPSEFPPSAHAHSAISGDSGTYIRWTGSQWLVQGLLGVGNALEVAWSATIGGNLHLPSATAATNSYTVAYINGDGRVSKGASSERYKKFISVIDPDSLGDIWPDLSRFQMRTGDGSWKYGYIAERLAEHPDQQPFVVYADIDGHLVPDSIDFIALLMAQNAQLRQHLDLLAQRIENLEGGA